MAHYNTDDPDAPRIPKCPSCGSQWGDVEFMMPTYAEDGVAWCPCGSVYVFGKRGHARELIGGGSGEEVFKF